MGLYPGRSISVPRALDSAVLYAAVYSNPITNILPVRPKDNVCICYKKYIQNGGQYVTVHDSMFSLYCCKKENVFWVTLSDYNGNGKILTLHSLNIAGVLDCFPSDGIIIHSTLYLGRHYLLCWRFIFDSAQIPHNCFTCNYLICWRQKLQPDRSSCILSH